MGLERFELLELRRDDGIQTFHAREIATARPLQVHLFPAAMNPEQRALLTAIDHLPESERSRVIERGKHQAGHYVVTEPLQGYSGLREWLALKPDARPVFRAEVKPAFNLALNKPALKPDAKPGPAVSAHTSLDQQFSRLFQKEPMLDDEPESEDVLPVAAKSALAALLGVVAAVVFLVLLIAVFAFRPR